MKKRTITLNQGRKVTAYCKGGLAVNKAPTDQVYWTITHIKSGLSTGVLLGSRKKAIRAMERLLRLDVDWSKGDEEVAIQLDEVSAMHNVRPCDYIIKAILADE